MLFVQKIPGIVLCLLIAIFAIAFSSIAWFQKNGISMLILAIVMGVMIGNTIYSRLERVCASGVVFSKNRILRLAIVLFGIKLTFQDIQAVGISAVFTDVSVIVTTFFLTLILGQHFFKLDQQSLILIGSGSSICGAAAVMATQPVIGASSEKVTVAVSTVVVFGTLAMMIYPVLYGSVLHKYVSAPAFGVFSGATVHEVAQVAAIGHSLNDASALNNAVTTKMIRVLMLAPFLFFLSIYQVRKCALGGCKQKIVIPWFAVGFILMACINSMNLIPGVILKNLIYIDDILLAMAMVALGLTTHFSVIKKAGLQPLLLTSLLFVWLMLGGAVIHVVFLSLFH